MSGPSLAPSSGRLGERIPRGLLRGYTILAFAFLLLPIAIIIPMSFSNQRYLGFPPPGWTLHWYEALGDQPRWLAAAINSFCIGIPPQLSLSFSAPWRRWAWRGAMSDSAGSFYCW